MRQRPGKGLLPSAATMVRLPVCSLDSVHGTDGTTPAQISGRLREGVSAGVPPRWSRFVLQMVEWTAAVILARIVCGSVVSAAALLAWLRALQA